MTSLLKPKSLALAAVAVIGLFAEIGIAEAAACKSGFVYRDLRNGDGICVTPAERAEGKQQNAAGANTRKADGLCRDGYVYRDAWNGDGVCVTPFERGKAKQQNAMHGSRVADVKPTPPKPTPPASSGVAEQCSNGVCGRQTYDGTRVNIYITTALTGITHYNFKTNPGAQIEIKGDYSFNAGAGRSGTYTVQACKRGGALQKSLCSGFATFNWRS
jgi:hypothetical protein